jgi:hypothetical protein
MENSISTTFTSLTRSAGISGDRSLGIRTQVTRKVIYRRDGVFRLSEVAWRRYAELKGVRFSLKNFRCRTLTPDLREDPALIQVIEELGPLANGPYADLMIAEIPANARYRIHAVSCFEFVVVENGEHTY